MTNIFEVIDPRGLKVICTEDCFHNHILVHHPSMKGCEEDIKLAIQQPTLGCIYQDAKRPERNIYYRLSKKGDRYVKVVVEFKNDSSGTVITAFHTSAPKSGEKLIWTKN